jgi:Sulfotransferase domain
VVKDHQIKIDSVVHRFLAIAEQNLDPRKPMISESSDVRSTLEFVISAPRSGTTWLIRALNAHPEIFATENRLFGEFLEVWPNPDGSTSPRITFDEYVKAFSGHFESRSLGLRRERFQRVFTQSYLQFLTRFCRARSGKSIVVDKITPYLGTSQIVLQKVCEYFPHAKLIHLIRDGRDVVTSGVFDSLLKDGPNTDRYACYIEHRDGFVLRRLFDDESLTNWAKHWREPIDALKHCARPMLAIRYESMKADHATELNRIFGFVQATSESALVQHCVEASSFSRMSGRQAGEVNPTAKARRGVVGDWKNYFTRRDGELFDQIAGDLLCELGYATDKKWVEQLPESLEISVQCTKR